MSHETLFDKSDSFWKTYKQGRPVPASFHKRILDYHRQQGGQFGTIHDVGAGGAVHTVELSKDFNKVLVSDISEKNIEVAEARLKEAGKKNVHFNATKLDNASWIEPGSVDLIFAGTCVHLTDPKRALEAFGKELRSGGTLAISCTTSPSFHDERVERTHLDMYKQGMTTYINGILGTERETDGLKGLHYAATAYKSVGIPTSIFKEGAQRYICNARDEWWYEIYAITREDLMPRVDHVGPTEKVERIYEKNWDTEMTFAGLKEHLDSFPVWGDYSEYQGHLDKFREYIGGGTVKTTWPHILILATKK